MTADQVAVDEKMIRVNGDEHWLSGGVDPKTNEIDPSESLSGHNETDDAMVSC